MCGLVCQQLKSIFIVCGFQLSSTTGSRKKQQTPLSLSTRPAWKCGCWLVIRWRQQLQPATPASSFAAIPRSWSWPPNAPKSRAFTMSCLIWVGLSWGNMEAWPGTPSLGMSVCLWETLLDLQPAILLQMCTIIAERSCYMGWGENKILLLS